MGSKWAIIGSWETHAVVGAPVGWDIISLGSANMAVLLIEPRLRVRSEAGRYLVCDGLIVGEGVRARVPVRCGRHGVAELVARRVEHWRGSEYRGAADRVLRHHVATHRPRRMVRVHRRGKGGKGRNHGSMRQRLRGHILTADAGSIADYGLVPSRTPFGRRGQATLRCLDEGVEVEVGRAMTCAPPRQILFSQRAILVEIDL